MSSNSSDVRESLHMHPPRHVSSVPSLDTSCVVQMKGSKQGSAGADLQLGALDAGFLLQHLASQSGAQDSRTLSHMLTAADQDDLKVLAYGGNDGVLASTGSNFSRVSAPSALAAPVRPCKLTLNKPLTAIVCATSSLAQNLVAPFASPRKPQPTVVRGVVEGCDGRTSCSSEGGVGRQTKCSDVGVSAAPDSAELAEIIVQASNTFVQNHGVAAGISAASAVGARRASDVTVVGPYPGSRLRNRSSCGVAQDAGLTSPGAVHKGAAFKPVPEKLLPIDEVRNTACSNSCFHESMHALQINQCWYKCCSGTNVGHACMPEHMG